jgi:hypothetical protein
MNRKGAKAQGFFAMIGQSERPNSVFPVNRVNPDWLRRTYVSDNWPFWVKNAQNAL